MEHIDHALEADGVDAAIGVALEALHDFKHTRAFAFPRLVLRMLASELGQTQRVPQIAHHFLRQRQQVGLGRPDPMDGFLVGGREVNHTTSFIPNLI